MKTVLFILGLTTIFLCQLIGVAAYKPKPPPIPDDLTGLTSMTLEEAWVTFQRYNNTDVIWGGPKGLLYANFPGSQLEQKANLYPDGASTYFVSTFVLQQGWQLTLKGQYPHARYFSYTIANALGAGVVGNGQFLASRNITPDVGSYNPFLYTVNRNVTERNYTVYIVQSDVPANPAPNTLYVANKLINTTVRLAIRTYLVDKGYDGTGNVLLEDCDGNGMPVATLTLPSGQVISGADLFNYLNVTKVLQTPYPLATWQASIAASNDTTDAPASSNITAQRFWNLAYSVAGSFYANDPLYRVQHFPPTSAGGFASNPETSYLSFAYSFSYGQVVVVQGKMPSHPTTQNGEPYFPQDPQVQYFSVSICGSPPSGQTWNTVHDEDVPLDSDGRYTIAISWPWNRPSNALLSNGIVWLDPGTGEGNYVEARDWVGVVIIRFQEPSPNWAQSPANIPIPTTSNPVPQDQNVMGDYYPVATYVSQAYFEANF